MALKSCLDCSGSISTKARLCPHCGAPTAGRSKAASILSWIVLFPIGLFTVTPFFYAVILWSYHTISGAPTHVIITRLMQ
jgi:hypothetical protein